MIIIINIFKVAVLVSGTNLYAFTDGLYQSNGSAWSGLTSLIPTNMVVSGTDMYASFAGSGLYQWNGSIWSSLTNLIPTNMVVSLNSGNSGNSVKIGDTGPAGGKVFYVDAAGVHGLEAALMDQASARWGCYGISIPGTSTAVG